MKASVPFAPKSKTVLVVDRPLNDIIFVQKRVNLRVSVIKLPITEWEEISIHLSAADGYYNRVMKLNTMKRNKDDDNIYSGTFNGISPGDYKIEVSCNMPLPVCMCLTRF